MSSKSSLISIFNSNLELFFDDIICVFPENMQVRMAKDAICTLKKINPKMIVRLWHIHLAVPYGTEIEKKDIEFFINKDYLSDVDRARTHVSHAAKADKNEIMTSIDSLREPVRNMGGENQQKSMHHIFNLTKISDMCHATGVI